MVSLTGTPSQKMNLNTGLEDPSDIENDVQNIINTVRSVVRDFYFIKPLKVDVCIQIATNVREPLAYGTLM